MELPLAVASASPKHVSADYYYRIPAKTIRKSYPVYHPSKEPVGYMDWLRRQEPQTVFDPTELKTEEDWVRAGRLVFLLGDRERLRPDGTRSPGGLFSLRVEDVQNEAFYREVGVPVAADGTVPFFQYVVLQKGMVSVEAFSCATCHTRVLPDGRVVYGAQGSLSISRMNVYTINAARAEIRDEERVAELVHRFLKAVFATPWLNPDPHSVLDRMGTDEILAAYRSVPPGVHARSNSSIFSPSQLPDLIGLKDRRYFDHTGMVRNRGIGDLMRYAALVQGAERYDRFGDYAVIPTLPDPATQPRYSDEQLYALTLWLYAQKPPANPNPFDANAAQGKKVFEREGCGGCHTPTLYTNNKLTPVDGFTVPSGQSSLDDIMPVSVGTNTALALRTRKGTGYYKVPSLRGVWYRGPLEHNGSIATLEDWFDPRRLRSDYVPTGWIGPNKTRSVKGHEFGLALSAEDKHALVAFLKTL